MKFHRDVVERQAFGARFEETQQDAAMAQRLKDGRLTMSPHKEWQLPELPTWVEDPFADSNWQFQYHSLRWLDPLRRVALRGDDEAKALWERYVKSWLVANPPGTSPTKWAWIDMGDALRTFELAFALPLFVDDDAWIVDALREHADWIADETHLGHGNHEFHQHQALFVAGCALGLPVYRDLAVNRLEKLLRSSYDSEGVNEEGSIGYQEQNYHWWQEALKRLELEGIPRPSGYERLALAPLSLAHATQPNGEYVRLGDLDTGGPARIDSPEAQYVASSGKLGSPPEDLIRVFEQGYVYGRSGWGETERDFEHETFFSLSFGRQNKIHGHQDGCSLTYYANGHPWLIDTGKYTYGTHPMRRYVVNRSGHNLLVLKGRAYDRTTEVELIRRVETGRVFDVTLRDTGYEGALLSRRVIYSKTGEYLIVLDRVSSTSSVEVEQRWHLSPETSSTIKGAAAHLESRNTTSRIQWLGSPGKLSHVRGSTEPFEGWTSTGWRQNAPTTLLKASRTGTQVLFNTVVGATESHAGIESAMRRLGDGGIEFTVPTAKGVEYVLVDKSSASISDVPFNENAESASISLGAADSVLHAVGGRAFGSIAGESVSSKRASALSPDSELMKLLVNPANRRAGLLATAIDIAGDDLELPSFLSGSTSRRRPMIAWPDIELLEDPFGTVKSYETVKAAGQDVVGAVQSVRLGPMTLSAHSSLGSGDTLMVGFHGALDRGKYSLPRFERLQGFSSLNRPHLLFSDPTLDLDPQLTLGWYLGTQQYDIQGSIANFVQERMTAGGYKRVIMSGSSGGGYAALQVAALVPDSTAVVFNPQTRIRQYFPRFANLALDTAFGQRTLSAEDELRVDVLARYKQLQPSTQIYFVQNIGDEHHEVRHRVPLVDALYDVPDTKLHTVFEDWGRGHKTANNDAYLKHLLLAQDFNW
ncbi:heparinase II/III domain-containing protein [Paenarthrobacter sp. NyZ202]|uniref:heparinase II/III domain-containing protein n=1 Tax=Paenarthrobacter sp. NyZ202 TaxID=3402689 RepID=UPI003CEA6F67